VIFEVLTAVSIKRTVLWGVTQCNLVEVHMCAVYFLLVVWLAYSSTLKMEEVRTSQTSVNFRRLHDITSHKTVLFIILYEI
jgi:hypothetical protein